MSGTAEWHQDRSGRHKLEHFASYNGTAPIEASSGERRRHRLNPHGNRQLNYAIHVAVITQLRYPCEGRGYSTANAPRARAPKKRSER